ncbi:MAG: SRPBCC family protein [Nitrosopumilus sp.]
MDIKKELVINASTSRVYDAITDMRQLSQWFPDVISIEPKVGGKVVFRSPNSLSNISDTIEGKIIELEKNKKLTYTWSHPDVPNFPLMRVSWNLEQMEKNKTRVMIVHSGFVDDNTVNSYNKRWVRIIEHLDVFAVSKKPANIQKQIAFVMIPISLSLIVMVAGGGLQNSDKFVSGFFWPFLLVASLISIPFINKYKKFSWMDKPLITSIGITVLAQIIVTVYWRFVFESTAVTPLIERLTIDVELFYPLMLSLLPIGLGISYAAIKFTNKSKIIQGTELVTIQFSERKINGLLIGLIAFQVFLNVLIYDLATL